MSDRDVRPEGLRTVILRFCRWSFDALSPPDTAWTPGVPLTTFLRGSLLSWHTFWDAKPISVPATSGTLEPFSGPRSGFHHPKKLWGMLGQASGTPMRLRSCTIELTCLEDLAIAAIWTIADRNINDKYYKPDGQKPNFPKNKSTKTVSIKMSLMTTKFGWSFECKTAHPICILKPQSNRARYLDLIILTLLSCSWFWDLRFWGSLRGANRMFARLLPRLLSCLLPCPLPCLLRRQLIGNATQWLKLLQKQRKSTREPLITPTSPAPPKNCGSAGKLALKKPTMHLLEHRYQTLQASNSNVNDHNEHKKARSLGGKDGTWYITIRHLSDMISFMFVSHCQSSNWNLVDNNEDTQR